MKIAALACDYDRTVTTESLEPSQAALDALAKVRNQVKLLLVTGRRLQDLTPRVLEVFHLLVIENGAMLYAPGQGVIKTFSPREWHMIKSLVVERVGDPTMEIGEVVVSLNVGYKPRVEALLLEAGLEQLAHLEVNRDRVMVLPRGVDKEHGLREALKILNVPPTQTACIGDGENDIKLFKVAGFKVAVANAVPELKELADYICEGPDGLGVREFVEKFIAAKH